MDIGPSSAVLCIYTGSNSSRFQLEVFPFTYCLVLLIEDTRDWTWTFCIPRKWSTTEPSAALSLPSPWWETYDPLSFLLLISPSLSFAPAILAVGPVNPAFSFPQFSCSLSLPLFFQSLWNFGYTDRGWQISVTGLPQNNEFWDGDIRNPRSKILVIYTQSQNSKAQTPLKVQVSELQNDSKFPFYSFYVLVVQYFEQETRLFS